MRAEGGAFIFFGFQNRKVNMTFFVLYTINVSVFELKPDLTIYVNGLQSARGMAYV